MFSGCGCSCHRETGANSGGCSLCFDNHSQPQIFTHPPTVNVYPDYNTTAILQKLVEILDVLKEIRKELKK